MKIKFFVSFLFSLGILLSACDNGEVYYQFKHIPQGKWSKENVLVFSLDSLPVNANKRYDIFIEISNSNQYAYQNLWLFIEQNLQDTIMIADTLEIEMTDIYGKWKGSGSGTLYQLSAPFKSALALRSDSACSIRIRQGMRDEPVQGIEKVGVKIVEKK